MYRIIVLTLALLVTLAITACGSAAKPEPAATALAQPTAIPTVPVTAMPTDRVEGATPSAASAPTSAATASPDWTQVAAVEGDYYVLGNPAAPLRLIDYSDFL